MKLRNIFSPYYIATVVVLIGINIEFQFIPLLNTIGYEFSAINSFILFILSAIIYLKNDDNEFINKNFQAGLIFLIPLLISLFNTAFLTKCFIGSEIGFYFVLTFPSFIGGISFGKLSKCLIKSRFRYLLFAIFLFVLIFIPLIEFYMFPQVYSYNLLIGYFPGVIYDEFVKIDIDLVLFRTLSIIFFITIISFVKFFRNSRISVLILLMVSSVSYYMIKYELGYVSNSEKVTSELDATYESDDFLFRYCEDIDSLNLNYIIMTHEYYYKKLVNKIGYKPERKIVSFIFSNKDQKKKIFGAKNADVAKPWQNSIFIDKNTSPNTIYHELAHVFSARFGNSFLQLPPKANFALIEGYAMSIVNNFGGHELHKLAKTAFEKGYKINIVDLFSGFSFLTNNSSLAYIYSGSFLKYLSDKYGMNKLNQVYHSANFEKVYGMNLENLQKYYYLFLSKYKNVLSKSVADLYFGRKPIIKKVCMRMIARGENEAWQLFNEKNYQASLNKFKTLFEISHSFNSSVGIVSSMKAMNQNEEALNFLESNLEIYYGTSSYNAYNLYLASFYVLNNKIDNAKLIYNNLIKMNPGYVTFVKAKTRLLLLRYLPDKTRGFFSGDNKLRNKILNELLDGTSSKYPLYDFIYSFNNDEKIDIQLMEKQLKKIFKSDSTVSHRERLMISEFFLTKGCLSLAHELLDYYLDSNDKNVNDLVEQKTKINWFMENQNDFMNLSKN